MHLCPTQPCSRHPAAPHSHYIELGIQSLRRLPFPSGFLIPFPTPHVQLLLQLATCIKNLPDSAQKVAGKVELNLFFPHRANLLPLPYTHLYSTWHTILYLILTLSLFLFSTLHPAVSTLRKVPKGCLSLPSQLSFHPKI